MSWYKISQALNQQPIQQNNPLETTLENSISQQRGKTVPLDLWLSMNQAPNTIKAEGVGAEYNLKEHDDNNMPEGGDNFIDTTEWNS
jgi:hypothetical protein